MGYLNDLMNKMRWILINVLRIRSCYQQVMNRFHRFINDVMFYFYLLAIIVGITDLTGFLSYFWI